YVGNRDRRLHGGVREVRREIFGFDDLAAFGEFGVGIAEGMHDFARLAGGLLQFFFIVGGVVGGVAAVVPFDFEAFAALEGGPGIVGDHGDAAERLKGVRRLEGIDRDGLF